MPRDDRDDPFDEFFEEIERMMNQMMGGAGEFHIEHSRGRPSSSETTATDVHLDIHEDEEEIRVIADLPGVEKEAIDLQCDGEMMTVEAAGSGREYSERVRLPARVDEHSADASYNNGILEVTFERADESRSIDI